MQLDAAQEGKKNVFFLSRDRIYEWKTGLVTKYFFYLPLSRALKQTGQVFLLRSNESATIGQFVCCLVIGPIKWEIIIINYI